MPVFNCRRGQLKPAFVIMTVVFPRNEAGAASVAREKKSGGEPRWPRAKILLLDRMEARIEARARRPRRANSGAAITATTVMTPLTFFDRIGRDAPSAIIGAMIAGTCWWKAMNRPLPMSGPAMPRSGTWPSESRTKRLLLI